MAVVVSFTRGHDASYPPKMIGTAEGPVIIGERYHPSAAEKGSEPAGTRRCGFEWAHRPANNGRVIAGFPEKAIARFSSHPAKITKTMFALADQCEKDRGAPDQRALVSMCQFANGMTRKGAQRAGLHRAATRLGTGLACGRAWGVARPRANHMARSTTRKRRYRRVVTRAQNSHRRQRGSRRAENSRMRKKARPSRSAAPLGADLGPLQTRLHADAAGG